MSKRLNRFKIFSKISEEIKQNIKIFHVFKEGKTVLFITSDDKVFGFGYNSYGCCGLGHNSVVNEPQIIPELCHKNIQQFFIGWTFILGLSGDKRVYGWGYNDCGQLGRGYIKKTSSSKEYFKPEIINFSSECIVQLSCGNSHCLALTTDGKVYGWGSNKFGQIGCGKGKGDKITSPLHLDIFPQFPVKTIYCSDNQSYALTIDGLVYSWGSNYYSFLGHELDRSECVYEPKRILNIPKIIRVCHSSTGSYFLTNEKQIYFCGYLKDDNNEHSIQKLPKLLKSELEFSSLYSSFFYPLISHFEWKLGSEMKITHHYTKCLSIYGKRVYELNGNEILETKYKSLFYYYSQKFGSTYKTIHIKSDQTFVGKDLKDLQKYKIFDKYFKNCYEMGSGGFGTLFKVEDKFNQQNFAVKRIPLKGQNRFQKLY